MSFWYPYRDPHDAALRLGLLADRQVGLGCGVTYSDGRAIAVLRKAHSVGGRPAKYLNVLCHRGMVPHSASRTHLAAPTFLSAAENFAWGVLALHHLTPADLRADGRMIATGASKVYGAARDHVWEPMHRWMIDPRHKTYMDGAGVAVDVLGVVAGAAFVLAIAPELGVAALVAGGAAALGSFVLLGIDGAVWVSEVTGHKEFAETIDSNHAVQWVKIGAAVMTIPDMGYGGLRALKEVRTLGREAFEGLKEADRLAEAAGETRIRSAVGRRYNSPKAQRLRHKANQLAKQAHEHQIVANRTLVKQVKAYARDLNAAYAATPAGAAMLSISPPSVTLSRAQREADEAYIKSVEARRHPAEPAGGLPRDVRLEMRVSTVAKARG